MGAPWAEERGRTINIPKYLPIILSSILLTRTTVILESADGPKKRIYSRMTSCWFLATIDVANKSINYYDSMNGNNQTCVDLLKRYLTEEHQDKKKSPMDLTGWKQEIKKDIPQQMNGSDCGMFTCKFAEYLARRAKITFSQRDMPYFRRRMVYEIVKNDVMKP